MSLIDRPEARRNYALAAIDPSDQAALGQYFTPYQAALDGDKFLGPCTVEPS
jgi:adenine-specific DNA-methyltransferase